MVRQSYKIYHFRPLVTVRPNDITDGGGVKISQHDSEQPLTRIFPRYRSFIVTMAKVGFGLIVLPPRCTYPSNKLRFKHSSILGLGQHCKGLFSDYHVAYVAVTDIDGDFLHSIDFDSLLEFMMTSAQRTPNQMCPSFIHNL